MVAAARAAFVDRGESELSATMFAEAGALVFHVALDAWAAETIPRSLADAVAEVMVLLAVDRAIERREPDKDHSRQG